MRSFGLLPRLVPRLLLLLSVFGAAGCGMLEPALPEANPQIPAEWPIPPTTAASETSPSPAAPEAGIVAEIGWRDFFTDPQLEQLVAISLENNRDLRVGVLNVERARGLYRIRRADRVPLALSGTLARQRLSREALLASATRANELSRIRYEAGSDSYLVFLDAQRSLFSAQQALVSTRLAEQARVNLYKALGGGWSEQ